MFISTSSLNIRNSHLSVTFSASMFSVTCQNGDQRTSKKIFKNTAMQTSEHSFLDGTRSPSRLALPTERQSILSLYWLLLIKAANSHRGWGSSEEHASSSHKTFLDKSF